MEQEKYLTNLFTYLKDNGYAIIKEYNYGYSVKAVSLSNRQYFKGNGELYNHSHHKFNCKYDLAEYLIKAQQYIVFEKDDKIQEQFFIKMFSEASKDEQRLMIKNIEDYLGHSWSRKFTEVFGQILNTPKEVEFLHSISISTWGINKVSLNDLDQLISSKGLSEKEVDDFYIKFFTKRKNQIKDATWGPEVKKFLVNKYGHNEDKLKPYCSFSNYIREIFEEIDLDILEPMNKITVLSRINCRKAAKLLCIPKHDEKEIIKLITKFVSLMARHKSISSTDVEDVGVGIIEIRCYTDNPFTQEELNKEIKDYLMFQKKNIDISLDAQNIAKYFMEKDLQSELGKNISITKKMKL